MHTEVMERRHLEPRTGEATHGWHAVIYSEDNEVDLGTRVEIVRATRQIAWTGLL